MDVIWLNFNVSARQEAVKINPEPSTPVMMTSVLIHALMTVSLSAFGMTLDAQVIGGFKRHHIRFVSGTAGLVTAQALHSEVFIPGVNHLFSDRVSGMGLPLVTLTAYADTDRGFRHQQNIIGRMRRMAAGAVPRFYRHFAPGSAAHFCLFCRFVGDMV